MFYQMISSPITHSTPCIVQLASGLLIRRNRKIAAEKNALRATVQLFRGVNGKTKNSCSGLNLGIVQLRTPTPEAKHRIRFLLYNHNGEEPVCIYRPPSV